MRIIFMGTPDFSVPVLQALVDSGHEIVAVYSQPPRPAGRGKKERPSPVHMRAEALGLEVRTPVNFKTEADLQAFCDLEADVAVVVAYGLILPQRLLEAPRLGCLNIHASLLPRWRGAAPIHRAIMSGDDKTGVCIMQMEAGLDTGPVLLRHEIPIGARETMAHLHDRLSDLGAKTIVEALENIENLIPETQGTAGVSYAAKIEKAEAAIDWDRPAAQVMQHIHGLSPFPGAYFEMQGTRIKVLEVEMRSDIGATAGQFLDDALTIACSEGALRLLRLQRAGKTVQDAEVFLNGWPIAAGTQV